MASSDPFGEGVAMGIIPEKLLRQQIALKGNYIPELKSVLEANSNQNI